VRCCVIEKETAFRALTPHQPDSTLEFGSQASFSQAFKTLSFAITPTRLSHNKYIVIDPVKTKPH